MEAATPAITQQDCDNAWADAQASDSCSATSLTAVNPSDTPDGNLYPCDLEASCAATEGGPYNSNSSYLGAPAGGVDDLVNCSGTLALSCSPPFSVITSGQED